MLLEKAWAKTLFNYVNAEKMIVEFAMEDILIAPALGFWVKNFNSEELYNLFNK